MTKVGVPFFFWGAHMKPDYRLSVEQFVALYVCNDFATVDVRALLCAYLYHAATQTCSYRLKFTPWSHYGAEHLVGVHVAAYCRWQ